jgi:hypothetical protein
MLMGTGMVLETSVIFNQLTWSIDPEDCNHLPVNCEVTNVPWKSVSVEADLDTQMAYILNRGNLTLKLSTCESMKLNVK